MDKLSLWMFLVNNRVALTQTGISDQEVKNMSKLLYESFAKELGLAVKEEQTTINFQEKAKPAEKTVANDSKATVKAETGGNKTQLPTEDKVIADGPGSKIVEHANGGTSIVATNTAVKGEEPVASTSQEAGVSEQATETVESQTAVDVPVVDAETSIVEKTEEEDNSIRAESREVAIERTKELIMEKVKLGIRDNNGRERDVVTNFMIKTFPLTEDESNPLEKSGRKSRNRLIEAIWKECTIEFKKETIAAPVTEQEVTNVTQAVSTALKAENKSVPESAPVKEVPAATTLATLKVPEKTKEVTAEEIQTAFELSQVMGPETLTAEDLPTVETLKATMIKSFEATEDVAKLKSQWVAHIQNRTDEATAKLRENKTIVDPTTKQAREVNMSNIFVDYVARQVLEAKSKETKKAA